MDRTLTKDTINKVGETVLLKGWVQTRRDHGKIVFIDIADRSGLIQTVSTSDKVPSLHEGYFIEMVGKIKERPEKLINAKITTGKIELEVESIKVLAKSAPLPFDMSKQELDLELPTLLDFRSLTLRHPKIKSVFKVQEVVLESFRNAAKDLDCTEIVVPTISASATEGGAEVFRVDYFGFPAYMIQSPQLYKQMLVPVFERVSTIAKAYRAEPSVTTRHLTESTQMDCEFGFTEFPELLNYVEQVAVAMLKGVEEQCGEILDDFKIPKIAYGKIPRLKMREVQDIIFKEYGRDVRGEKDLAPQDEIDICKWALEKYGSDLVTVTHYPTKKRAFYTMPDPKDPEFSLSYDLLFRGVEMLSGSQRINDYDELMAEIENRGMDSKNFEMYLMAFKYGMPPEGGFSFGLERLTKNILNLENIRQATLYPRDMERVDLRLSEIRKNIKPAKSVFIQIKELLDLENIRYQVLEHEAVFTSEQAAQVRDTKLEQGAKAMIMVADGTPMMIVVPANLKVSSSKFKKANEIKDFHAASKEEVEKWTQTKIGAVPPFGNLFKLPLYVDRTLGKNEEIVFNAGEHTKSIKMKYKDFEKITKPILGEFSAQ